ncbi:hypothetical protein HAX54_010956 [Datura stramonium]|uniref:Uncharacterized protein n=1 Tax=Datura stramonium TaxID=4076 RepID=A0ABS8TIY0_DATST|nr:hypothetical protein [Datura stramonium]
MSLLFMGIALLQKPMEDLIVELSPHCIFSDVCLTWTVDIAEQLKVPRLTFYPHNLMFHCVEHCLNVYTPHDKVSLDSESFLIPGLPDKIEMKRSQLSENINTNPEGPYWEMMKRTKESEPRSYAMIHDTIYDLESTYAELYQKIKGKKAWLIGPLFYFSKREESSNSKNTAVQERHSCLSWFDSQEPNFVVVRKGDKTQENEQENWMPASFKGKILTNKGLIVGGWVPQLKILNHPATGSFMTHCGWNSILESLTAGVPMLTWPLFAKQFYNEKLVEVLGCGVGVGVEVCHSTFDITDTIVKNENIEASVKILMNASRKSEKTKSRAKDVEVMIKRSMEKGGSSYNHLTTLIKELKCHVFGTLEE